eukprot:1603489-Rhodomonas_salina.9
MPSDTGAPKQHHIKRRAALCNDIEDSGLVLTCRLWGVVAKLGTKCLEFDWRDSRRLSDMPSHPSGCNSKHKHPQCLRKQHNSTACHLQKDANSGKFGVEAKGWDQKKTSPT